MLTVMALAALLGIAAGRTVYDKLPILVMKNAMSMEVHLSPVGATIQKLLVPGREPDSKQVDVALGHDNITLYTVSVAPTCQREHTGVSPKSGSAGDRGKHSRDSRHAWLTCT
jgi:hypothetical protein